MGLMVLIISVLLLNSINFSKSTEVCGKFNENGASWNVGFYKENSNGHLQLKCLGSIIGPNIILTAARCFCEQFKKNLLDDEFYILAGLEAKNVELNQKPPTIQKVLKSNIFIHEKYEGALGFYEYDIALVKLTNKLTYDANINQVCVDWGNTNPNIQSKSIGKQVVFEKNGAVVLDVTPLEFEECTEESYRAKIQDFLTNDKICTKSNGKVFDLNASGSGLLIKENNSWHIKGIWDSQDNMNHKTNLYTRVNRYLDWITKTLVLISKK